MIGMPPGGRLEGSVPKVKLEASWWTLPALELCTATDGDTHSEWMHRGILRCTHVYTCNILDGFAKSTVCTYVRTYIRMEDLKMRGGLVVSQSVT